MIAYLSVEKDMMRFRTEDKSIDVYFFNTRNVTEVCKVSSFINGVIKAKVRINYPFGMENNLVCNAISELEYDIHNILDLLGISAKALDKVTKVKVKKSDGRKNKYYFRSFSRNGTTYIEVTDKTKKYRSVHNTVNKNLIATNMTRNMVDEYEAILKYHNTNIFLNKNGFFESNDDNESNE